MFFSIAQLIGKVEENRQMVDASTNAERVINNYLTICQHYEFAIMSQLIITAFEKALLKDWVPTHTRIDTVDAT